MLFENCKCCGEPVPPPPNRHGTVKKYCSTKCREEWWNNKRRTGANWKRTLVEVTELDLAYLAGLVDGEGTVGIWRAKRKENKSGYTYRGVIEVYNTNREVLEWIESLCGGSVVTKNHKDADVKRKKTCYRWACSAASLRSLVSDLEPFIKIKKRQLQSLKKFLLTLDNTSRRASSAHPQFEKYWRETKTLNQRGSYMAPES